MFLIGSPGREVSNLRKEAAEAPQRILLARTLPSQEIAYYLMPKNASYFRLSTYSLSIQAIFGCQRTVSVYKHTT
jgi:hypothetical protein